MGVGNCICLLISLSCCDDSVFQLTSVTDTFHIKTLRSCMRNLISIAFSALSKISNNDPSQTLTFVQQSSLSVTSDAFIVKDNNCSNLTRFIVCYHSNALTSLSPLNRRFLNSFAFVSLWRSSQWNFQTSWKCPQSLLISFLPRACPVHLTALSRSRWRFSWQLMMVVAVLPRRKCCHPVACWWMDSWNSG